MQRPDAQVWYQITVIRFKSISIRQKNILLLKVIQYQGRRSIEFCSSTLWIWKFVMFLAEDNLIWAGDVLESAECRAGSRIAIIKLNLKPRIPNLYGRFTAENLVNGILCEFLLEKEWDRNGFFLCSCLFYVTLTNSDGYKFIFIPTHPAPSFKCLDLKICRI